MSDDSFAKRLQQSFQGPAGTVRTARTKIDARTVGYPTEHDPRRVEWMGMSPVDEKGDLWYVLSVTEEQNEYLSQVAENERLVDVGRVIGRGPNEKPLSFEKAVEYLAVWEHARMMRGFRPAPYHTTTTIGRHHYKDLTMRRGFVVSTTGALSAAPGAFPRDGGKYLKSDLKALEQYRSQLTGENILDELLRTHDPLYIRERSIDDDIEAFGEISVFDKMALSAEILLQYARVKLDTLDEFYARPAQARTQGLAARVSQHPYFDAVLLGRANALREQLSDGILRFFHFRKHSWDVPLDLNNRDMRVELLKNPDAQKAINYLQHRIASPMGTMDLESLLFVSARTLVYFREMMRDSAQKEALERRNIFQQADVNDLLNFLDLLEIKYQYKALAEEAFALPGTARYRELASRKQNFEQRVRNLKDNLKEAADFSPVQEKQIDDFIKAGSHVYLLDRLVALPGRLRAAHDFVCDQILPRPQQLRLDLDFSQSNRKPVAAPTRGPLPPRL